MTAYSRKLFIIFRSTLLAGILMGSIFSAVDALAEEINTEGAGNTKVKKDLSGYGTMDMNQFKQVEQSEQNKNSKVFSVTCKNDAGVEIKPEDPQYRICMERAQNKALQEKAKKSH